MKDNITIQNSAQGGLFLKFKNFDINNEPIDATGHNISHATIKITDPYILSKLFKYHHIFTGNVLTSTNETLPFVEDVMKLILPLDESKFEVHPAGFDVKNLLLKPSLEHKRSLTPFVMLNYLVFNEVGFLYDARNRPSLNTGPNTNYYHFPLVTFTNCGFTNCAFDEIEFDKTNNISLEHCRFTKNNFNNCQDLGYVTAQDNRFTDNRFNLCRMNGFVLDYLDSHPIYHHGNILSGCRIEAPKLGNYQNIQINFDGGPSSTLSNPTICTSIFNRALPSHG